MNKRSQSPLSDDQLRALSDLLADESGPSGGGIKSQVAEFIDLIRSAMWPEIFTFGKLLRQASRTVVADRLEQAAVVLSDLLAEAAPEREDREGDVLRFFEALPGVKALLATDVEAAFEGDPAARTHQEVMLSYPAFEAISIFRLAHVLYEEGIPLLPRMMTEYAHRLTGIDIHPGAKIGPYFFIDHGTGVVIGETTVIGEHVKLYQGVTLGARSFPLDADGNPVKGIKRHPNIGNNVIIYSGATILGGDTTIGDGCVIGGNVWLTHSVPAGEKILSM